MCFQDAKAKAEAQSAELVIVMNHSVSLSRE